jgi:hypothetical protein
MFSKQSILRLSMDGWALSQVIVPLWNWSLTVGPISVNENKQMMMSLAFCIHDRQDCDLWLNMVTIFIHKIDR